MNLNRNSQFRTDSAVCWNYGKRKHYIMDCLKLRNEKGKDKVEFTYEIASIVDSKRFVCH